MRIITLEKGSAAALAEALGKLLSKMRANPVKVVVPGGKETAPKPAPKPPKEGAKLPGKADAPVTITAVGNQLILASEDAEALALAQDVVRLLTAPGPGEGDFEVIRLRHASAAAVARTLDEAFNGPQKAEIPPKGFGPPARRADRIRVVAEPVTNSVLVRASPIDVLSIRRLIERSLDIDAAVAAADTRVRPRIIGPLKHAKAAEIAKVLTAVYRPAGQAEPTLTVGVDERTNSLVIRCSDALLMEIQGIVTELDRAAAK
jgi:type II secretory pathway component GspD/PulD (secretin)